MIYQSNILIFYRENIAVNRNEKFANAFNREAKFGRNIAYNFFFRTTFYRKIVVYLIKRVEIFFITFNNLIF